VNGRLLAGSGAGADNKGRVTECDRSFVSDAQVVRASLATGRKTLRYSLVGAVFGLELKVVLCPSMPWSPHRSRGLGGDMC